MRASPAVGLFKGNYPKKLFPGGTFSLCLSSRKQGISSPAVLSHHRAYRSVHGGSLSFEPNLLVDRFLEVIFSHPAKSPPSHIAFGCRPILLWPGLQIIGDFLRSTFHKVTFIHLLKLKVQPFPS